MRRWGGLVAVAGLALLACAAVHAAEKFNRGLVAAVNSDGKAYLGWRLLKDDPAGVAFNVYRRTAGGKPVRVNSRPIATSTNLVDMAAPMDQENVWYVRPVAGGRERAPSERVTLVANSPPNQVFSIKLQGAYAANKVAIADLNGDGVFDYVIKQPGGGLDPGSARPSPDTYKLEAYDGKTGRFLWRYDLGWNMNMGVWWTPYVVADLNGDGKAEVALKMAPYAATREQALISPNGFVLEGPEYVTILDGTTGKEITHAGWVERGDPARWGDDRGNRVNRNQIGIARLDGNTTSLLVARGTYTLMYVDAYNLVQGKLVKLWRWFGDETQPPIRGQGGHGMHIYDFDGDGREEMAFGSFLVDDNGKTVWANGLGHADVFYAADIIPERPGLEIAYGYENRQQGNGIQVADARTGKMIWGHPNPTAHIHDWGMFADIDPSNPGYEFYSAEQNRKLGQFLYSARDGQLLSKEDLGAVTLRPFYWLDGPQKVYHIFSYRSNAVSFQQYKGNEPVGQFPGRLIAIADVLGDWREELILADNGVLRIATTTAPATTRHVNLMQDPLYRNDVAHVSMGYFYPPNTSYNLFPEAFK
jgi:rhamnogalacturonan endolyase